MKLGNKLLFSFAIMLLLTMVIAFTGWRAMEAMHNQTLVLSGTEISVSRMLRAQVRQLLFGSSGDPEIASSVFSLLADAKKELADSRSHMLSSDRRAMADKGVDFLNWYEARFENLRALSVQVRTNEANIDKDCQVILDNFAQLVRNIEIAIEKAYTPAAFASMKSATRAQMAFVAARHAASVFSIRPSAETASVAKEDLVEALQNCQETITTLRVPTNIQLAQEIVTRLKAYIDNFESLSKATLDSANMTQEIRNNLLPSLDNMQQLSSSTMQAAMDAKRSGNTTALVVTLCSLLVGLGIAVAINRNVGKQLGKDPADLNTIAQRVTDGDYNIDDGSPRVGVYGSLLHMVSSLHEHINNATSESQRAHQETERAQEAMKEARLAGETANQKAQTMLAAAGKLEEVALIVSSASNRLAEQIEESERGASTQATRVTETATAMAQMNSTVLEVAKNAGIASEVSASTREKAEAGARVVLEAVHSIQEVQTQSAQLREDMQKLDENARAISQIMGVISDIADQTNLLALNAAIEAARAGEAGRGFAVVADEVRKLAEKTMASTHDVGNAIRAIQESASQSMAQVDRAGTSIEEATRFANQSGTALKEIVSMVDNTADQVRAIAAASEEQSATSDEINSSIGEVNSIAAKTVTAMEEAARAVADLANQTHVLTGLIEDMKRG